MYFYSSGLGACIVVFFIELAWYYIDMKRVGKAIVWFFRQLALYFIKLMRISASNILFFGKLAWCRIKKIWHYTKKKRSPAPQPRTVNDNNTVLEIIDLE